MKKITIVLLFSLICCSQPSKNANEIRKIENLKTFAKVYGYVKYFHPSDEAAEIDWISFAIYGADRVKKCKSKDELVSTLEKLFSPIAPSIHFKSKEEFSELNLKDLIPKDLKDYQPTYWQHSGVGIGMNSQYRSPYHSSRVNAIIKKEYSNVASKITMSISASKYKNKKIKYQAFAKTKDSQRVKGYLRLAAEKSDGSSDLKRAEIIGNQWKRYEVIENLDSLSSVIKIGLAMKGKGSIFFDDVKLFYQNKGNWIEIPVPGQDFEKGILVGEKEQNQWYYEGVGYTHELTSSDYYNGKKSALIQYTGEISLEKGQPLYDNKPKFGEVINKEIGDNIYCQIPLVLYSNNTGTFPLADKEKFKKLIEELELVTNESNMESIRMGNVINTYNVFQHFYPYMGEVDVNWDQELENTLTRSLVDTSGYDHMITLQKFTAPLKDGHISVNYNKKTNYLTPPITWEWIENKLVITNVLEDKIPLKIGDIVTHIEGKSAEEYFEEINSRISAGTIGWLNHKAKQLSLVGEKDSEFIIKVNDRIIKLKRDTYPYGSPVRQSDYEKINDSTYYLNMNSIAMEDIRKLLPELKKSSSIICDLRVYPKGNHEFISYLLKENDTTTSWMKIPQVNYPDGDSLVGARNSNWMLPSKKPFLGDKQIIFITQGSAISYAESYMGFIHGYKLATIVGQPTAGTNGNINRFELFGGYSIIWTGMKVTKHDGSQLHGIGFLPDIYVDKTINGVKEGRDEFLEKAIELTKIK